MNISKTVIPKNYFKTYDETGLLEAMLSDPAASQTPTQAPKAAWVPLVSTQMQADLIDFVRRNPGARAGPCAAAFNRSVHGISHSLRQFVLDGLITFTGEIGSRCYSITESGIDALTAWRASQ